MNIESYSQRNYTEQTFKDTKAKLAEDAATELRIKAAFYEQVTQEPTAEAIELIRIQLQMGGFSVPQAIANTMLAEGATLRRTYSRFTDHPIAQTIGEFYPLIPGLFLLPANIDSEIDTTRRSGNSTYEIEIELLILEAEAKAQRYGGDAKNPESLQNKIARLLKKDSLGLRAITEIPEDITLISRTEDSEILPEVIEDIMIMGMGKYMSLLNSTYERYPEYFRNASQRLLAELQLRIMGERLEKGLKNLR